MEGFAHSAAFVGGAAKEGTAAVMHSTPVRRIAANRNRFITFILSHQSMPPQNSGALPFGNMIFTKYCTIFFLYGNTKIRFSLHNTPENAYFCAKILHFLTLCHPLCPFSAQKKNVPSFFQKPVTFLFFYFCGHSPQSSFMTCSTVVSSCSSSAWAPQNTSPSPPLTASIKAWEMQYFVSAGLQCPMH